MKKPTCLISENIDDHNWENEMIPSANVVTRMDCIDCFCSYYYKTGEELENPWSHRPHRWESVWDEVLQEKWDNRGK